MRTKLCLSLLLVLWVSPASAERYAVLIGIQEYQELVHNLNGPVNDVECLKNMLVGKYGFAEKNTAVLLDRQATREHILATLSQLPKTTKAGDFIFIYFSGHGTSAFDPTLSLPLGDATGALIPYEFKPDRKNKPGTLARLIIGKRDLRPIFTELDRDRKLLVVFDSCFSEHAARSAIEVGTPKQIPLKFDELDHGSPPAIKPVAKEPYPYRNIIYVSASGEAERALDIPRGRFDGKPHGALTDALLSGLSGKADLNHDGTISYEEFFQFAKRQTNEKYGQSPQLFYRESVALSKPVFEVAVRQGESKSDRLPSKLQVRVEGKDRQALAAKVKAIPGAEVVDGEYDLLLATEGSSFALYLTGGELLFRLQREPEALARVGSYARVRELVSLRNSEQRFNVWLQAGDNEGKVTFREGETLHFIIRSEEDAYLLLLSVDPEGNVCMLLPESEKSEPRISKGQRFQTKETDPVGEPLGVEFLKLFAFREKVPGLDNFAHGDGVLSATGKELPQLLELIKRQRNWAETVQQVVTVKRR